MSQSRLFEEDNTNEVTLQLHTVHALRKERADGRGDKEAFLGSGGVLQQDVLLPALPHLNILASVLRGWGLEGDFGLEHEGEPVDLGIRTPTAELLLLEEKSSGDGRVAHRATELEHLRDGPCESRVPSANVQRGQAPQTLQFLAFQGSD